MPSYEPDKIESRDRRELVAPVVFIVLSFVLIVLPVSFQQDISFALRRSVLAPFILTQEALQKARLRAGEISEIQIQMDSLTALLLSQSTVREENERLRILLELRDRGGPAFLPASAVRPGTEGSESMFLLDVGAEDGVSVDDPVVVAKGLVGVVREVGPRTALAMDWTHPDFRVSVMTEDGGAFGIVGPRRGTFREDDRLLLDGIPYYATVTDGALVLTSGMGRVYPRGILVGEVLEAAESEEGWRKSFWLRPAVPPGSATHVLVLIRGDSGLPDSFGALWGFEEEVDSLGITLPASDPEPTQGVDLGEEIST
jgi:rod shape-determining protein MreC